jgi:hypothetical protein
MNLRSALTALAIGALALAVPAAAAEFSSAKGDNGSVEVTGAKPDVVFAAAHQVHVAATSSDDVFAVGHDVRLDTGTADHAFAAGQTVSVTGDNARAYLAAGHDLSFQTGSAANDVLAFGQDITFSPTFKIGGTAVIFGQDVHLQAPVGRDLVIGGNSVTIDSAVTGNVRAEGRHIVIGPNAKIGGDLSYRAGDKIEISPQAVITGKKIELPPGNDHWSWSDHHGKRGAGMMGGLKSRLHHDLWGAVSFLILSLVMTAVFPLLMARSGALLTRNPLLAAGVGLLVLIAGPVVAIIVMVTLVGATLALAMLSLIGAALMIGFVGAAAGVASLAGRIGKSGDAPRLMPQLLWTALGAIVLCVLGAIPYVGGWVWLLACILGTGAIATQARSLMAKGA